MSTIQIKEAKRSGANLLIGLAGVSGAGKTFSALRLAYGMANGNAKKIGLLDTENKRGSLYADKLPGRAPFLIGDLIPPFSPDRYISAIKEFQAAGIEVLITDSVSHEWECEGGCQDIAENNKLGGLPNWALAKAKHKKFVNTLLYTGMHIIVCMRAREKARPEQIIDPDTGKKKTVYISEGIQAITEKNFLFEMTASLMVTDLGKTQTVIKCPADLMPYLGRGKGYLTEDDGRAIRQWVDGAEADNPDVEKFRGSLIEATENGIEALRVAWNQTPKDIQKVLGAAFLDSLKASAAEYDKQKTVTAANDNDTEGDA